MVFVKYPKKNGVISIRMQCIGCGVLATKAFKHSKFDLNSLPFYDKKKREEFQQKAINRSLLKKDYYNRNESYYKEVYLTSKEWKNKRDRIIKRDDGKCRSCKNPATEVHHIHYRNVYNEKDKQLISLCRKCHETVHFSKEKILMDGFDLKKLNDCQSCGEYHENVNNLHCNDCCKKYNIEIKT
jgi:hypothetical protein